ncbi:MAG: RluA family pseudouridine synthase [Clostridia bacterium]|nr:RluA family pseudouridine synthase [Oscillospiraceae bacterium]MDY5627402.1 RluA family pseudouridine synthase [Clostridia bacterium]
MKTVTINKNDANQRLDKFLTKFFKNMPQSAIYKYVRKKRVKVNGKKGDIDYRLCEGDVLSLYINDEFFCDNSNNSFLNITPKLNILYEDKNIILVDKDFGMVVHEDKNEQKNTLVNHIKAYLFQKGEYDPKKENSFSPALCNRIDRNTGGIVIAAKNAETLKIINEKIKMREIKKFYLCLVWGHLKEKSGLLTGYLFKDCKKNTVFVYDTEKKGAKIIKTKYTVLEERQNTSLVEVELITGRTHQIRAHFAHIGHPLIGDGKYGSNEINKHYKLKHQALYSYKVRFDFSDENILSYLNGREFCVKNVPFAKEEY